MKKTNIAILSAILISTFILTLPVYAKSVVQNHKVQIQGPYITLPSSPKPFKELFEQWTDNNLDFSNLDDFCYTQSEFCWEGCGDNENVVMQAAEEEDWMNCLDACHSEWVECLGGSLDD